MADHERPLHGAVEMNGRGLDCVIRGQAADERRGDGSTGEQTPAPELPARLGVLEAPRGQHRVDGDEGTGPADGVEEQRGHERCTDREQAHRAVDERELEGAERDHDPARLVGEDAVVDRSRVLRRCRSSTQRARQPTSGEAPARRAPRGGAAASLVSSRPLSVYDSPPEECSAAYFAPAIVSAAGKPTVRDTGERQRPPLVADRGTVESGASTIQPSYVSSWCASTRSASSGSCR